MKNAAENKKLSFDEIDNKARSKGIFIILSSESVKTSEFLPLYYTRQTFEDIVAVYGGKKTFSGIMVY